MTAPTLAHVTHELIASYGATARNVIKACRVGQARFSRYADQRWSGAVHNMGNRLTAEVRTNALAAQQKVFAYYARGVDMGTDGAEEVVNKAVGLASKGVKSAAIQASRFEKASGIHALSGVAAAVVPAAVAVRGVAARVEARSSELVAAIAGKPAKARAKAVRKPRKAAVPAT